MKRYLLSSGSTTTDIVDYAIDYIKVFLLTNYNDVPYYYFGNTMDLTVNTKTELLYQVKIAVNKAITNLNTQFDNLSASLTSLEFNSMNNLVASISMNGQKFNMVIGS